METLEQKFAVMERLWAYFFALDALEDAEGLRSFFTKDALWECYNHGCDDPALRFTSVAEVEAALSAAQAQNRDVLLKHHLTGLTFDVLNAERAVTRAKVMVTIQSSSDPAPRVRNTATCEGEWCRNERGWKLKRWTIRRDPAA